MALFEQRLGVATPAGTQTAEFAGDLFYKYVAAVGFLHNLGAESRSCSMSY